MPDIRQKKKLKRLNKIGCIKYDEVSESDMEIYEYLKSLGYVKIYYNTEFQHTREGITLVPTEPREISISERGKDYLAGEKSRKIEVWLPHIITFSISIIALICSLLSLSTTAPEVWKSIQTLLGHY